MSVCRPAVVALLWVILSGLAGTGMAQDPAPPLPARETAAPAVSAARRLPPDATTRHVLEVQERSLPFTATAGSIRLFDPQGAAQADIAFIAYRLDTADPRTRPVTFALNGGPGASSAWLHLGALGPWRLKMDGDAARPSATPTLLSNAETWLDFTDLVFIDPVGTGYTRLLDTKDDTRRRFWSVDGDIQSLAAFIRRWLQENHRAASPKFLVGESYGGFRGPRLARALQADQGIGLSGLMLISPALDLSERTASLDPLAAVGQLPSMVAASRAMRGPVAHAALEDAERYAAGDYLLDLVRGESDPDAIARISERVAALTGLDPDLIRRHHGRLSRDLFLRALAPSGRIASVYDAITTGLDPFPGNRRASRPDPVLDALVAPATTAMLDLYSGKLDWNPTGQAYEVLNRAVFREWNWGRGRSGPESVTSLRTALAIDPNLRVVIAHGLFDLVTPYFATRLMLNQIPRPSGGDRVRFVAWPGGHMVYAADDARSALRNEARALVEPR